jgi:hypothetical protein
MSFGGSTAMSKRGNGRPRQPWPSSATQGHIQLGTGHFQHQTTGFCEYFISPETNITFIVTMYKYTSPRDSS